MSHNLILKNDQRSLEKKNISMYNLLRYNLRI